MSGFTTGNYLADLGVRIERDGLACHRGDIMALVALSHAHGVGGPAADVLADWAAPEVARYRAFGRVAAAFEGDRYRAVERAA